MIKVAIVGVGNCASSLVQGIEQFREQPSETYHGIMFPDVGGYGPTDIEFVRAFDVDQRKIGLDLFDAIYEKPNCTFEIMNLRGRASTVTVEAGPRFDGVAEHMNTSNMDDPYRFNAIADNVNGDVALFADKLKASKTDVLLNYLPVGSTKGSHFWAEVCLRAGVAFVNCIPVFIASDKKWAKKFLDAGLPIIGDDMRSQIGASIISAVLQELFISRGIDVTMHYQDNIGGNTDFLNMQDQTRLVDKKISKENVIIKQNEIAGKETEEFTVAAGPANYFTALGDNKRAHWLIKGTGFGGAPVEFTADLSVQDSPNSAGVVIEAIRLVQVARDLSIAGPVVGPSAWTQKTPPVDAKPADAHFECCELVDGVVPGGYVKNDAGYWYYKEW